MAITDSPHRLAHPPHAVHPAGIGESLPTHMPAREADLLDLAPPPPAASQGLRVAVPSPELCRLLNAAAVDADFRAELLASPLHAALRVARAPIWLAGR